MAWFVGEEIGKGMRSQDVNGTSADPERHCYLFEASSLPKPGSWSPVVSLPSPPCSPRSPLVCLPPLPSRVLFSPLFSLSLARAGEMSKAPQQPTRPPLADHPRSSSRVAFGSTTHDDSETGGLVQAAQGRTPRASCAKPSLHSSYPAPRLMGAL
jgi:hypothetical protein